MTESSDNLIMLDAVLVHQLVEALDQHGDEALEPEFAEALAALRHVRNRIVHQQRAEDTPVMVEEARAAVTEVRRFLSHLEQSSLGTPGARAVRRMSAPSELNEIMSRSVNVAARRGGVATMSSDQYRRQLQNKQSQQASAEKKAGDARRKEAERRADAAKARSSGAKTKSATTARTRSREAERHEDAANKAAKDASYWHGKAAGYGKDVADLQKRLARAEQSEVSARERGLRNEAQASERRIVRAQSDIEQRVSATEEDVAELREMRPPKAEPLRILMLAASGRGDLRIGREQSRVRRAVQGALHRDLVDIETRTSATPADLLEGLTTFRPHVVHFSGHGDDELIVFEEDVDMSHEGVVVAAKTFGRALAALDDPPLLVMLNSCHSAAQIDALVADVVPFAIGMSDEIGDHDAIEYAARFYSSIANGSSLREAHLISQTAIELEGLPGSDLPRLAHAAGTDPGDTVLVVPPEEEGVARARQMGR